MPSLRNDLIRLAHANPELRSSILPLVKSARGSYNLNGWTRQVSRALSDAHADGAGAETPDDMPNYPVADASAKTQKAIQQVHTLLHGRDPDLNKLALALVEAVWWMGHP
jgi:hypothetical protein